MKKFSFLTFLLLLSVSCSKNSGFIPDNSEENISDCWSPPTELPPTNVPVGGSGKRLGFLKNDEVWTPVRSYDGLVELVLSEPAITLEYSVYEDWYRNLHVQGVLHIEDSCNVIVNYFNLNVSNPRIGSDLEISPNTTFQGVDNGFETGIYRLDTLGLSNVDISVFDLQTGHVTGTFSFDLINSDNTDTLRIRDGRFDGNL